MRSTTWMCITGGGGVVEERKCVKDAGTLINDVFIFQVRKALSHPLPTMK